MHQHSIPLRQPLLMKIPNQQAYICLLFIVFSMSISCSTEKADEYLIPPVDLKECHLNIAWTADNTRSHLLGQWTLSQQMCPLVGEVGIPNEIVVSFEENNVLTILESDQVPVQSTWSIQPDAGGYFKIETDPYVHYLHGTLILCEEVALVYESGISDYCEYFLMKE